MGWLLVVASVCAGCGLLNDWCVTPPSPLTLVLPWLTWCVSAVVDVYGRVIGGCVCGCGVVVGDVVVVAGVVVMGVGCGGVVVWSW